MILRFVLEGYLELAMACFINFRNVRKVTLNERVNFWFSFSMRWSLFIFPVFITLFVRWFDEKTLLSDNSLRNVFGSIYEGLKL